MKKGIFSENKVKLIRSVEQEFEMFKYKKLLGSRQSIFDSCNEIRFYSCLYEYFQYSEDISEEHIRVCLNCGGEVIATLYRVYMDIEYLRYSRWEDIEEILNVLVWKQEKHRILEGA